MTSYRVAIIGTGSRAVAHANAYSHIDNAVLTACASPTEARREKFAAKYGIRAYADASEMIRIEQPDLVHIVTPPSVRLEPMTIVSELGVPACTVEKPIALEVSDWKQLESLERTSRTKFGVCHQLRWFPSLIRCRDAIASGALGQVLMIDSSAGMDITNQGTHALHYGNFLNGDRQVVEVFGAASGWNQSDPSHPGPENSLGTLAFDNGVRMLWTTGPTAPRAGDPGTVWQHVRIGAFTETGRVLFEEFGRREIVGDGPTLSGDYGGMEGWKQENHTAQIAFHKDMLDWVHDDNAPVGTSLSRSLHEWKAVLALYASVLSRQPIRLDSFDPEEDLVETLRKTLTHV